MFDTGGAIRHGMVASTVQGRLSAKELDRRGKDLVDITREINGFF